MAHRSPYTIFDKRGIAHLNATIAGVRYKPSLNIIIDGTPANTRAIEAEAATRYAQLVVGRTLKPTGRINTDATLEELLVVWLEERRETHPKSIRQLESQTSNIRDFGTLADLADDQGPYRYGLSRLKKVTRRTMALELSTIWAFFEWCVREKYLLSFPSRPKFPPSMIGVRSSKQRENIVAVSHEEALKIIDALPEVSQRRGRPRVYRTRDRVRFQYETGLRPGAVAKLSVPRHWSPGQTHLQITADIDKVQNARKVPLTQEALACLQRCAPKVGLIFGEHCTFAAIKKAAAIVLDPGRAKHFAPYDFRHARAVEALRASGNLLGVAHLLGHKQITTTNRYLKTSEGHAGAVIRALEQGVPTSSPSSRNRRKKAGSA